MHTLPQPSPDALKHSERLRQFIREQLAKRGGWLPFSEFMHLALYAPALGYYSAGSRKFGVEGDFITAPEMTPLFAQAIAQAIAPTVRETGGVIYEFGAGSGVFAAELLDALEQLNCPVQAYFIIEVSADLIERQKVKLEKHSIIQWISELPLEFHGVIVGNEVLDAQACELIEWDETGQAKQVGVIENTAQQFELCTKAIKDPHLKTAVDALPTQKNYRSELQLAAQSFVKTLGERLKKGAILLIDYGFPQHEYYHPERSRGTFMCHYRHHAHDDPFAFLGLQDLTTHIDFTAIAQAGIDANLQLISYLSQAQFLMNANILEALQAIPAQTPDYFKACAQVQTLLSPAEMGELFKVIIFGKDIDLNWHVARVGDRTHTL